MKGGTTELVHSLLVERVIFENNWEKMLVCAGGSITDAVAILFTNANMAFATAAHM